MNKFYNRVGQNLNRKELEVVSIERDASGEITSLVVDENRCDSDIQQEGTALEANVVNTIIRNMILEELSITDLERVTDDKNALSYESSITENIVLPLYGEKGSKISWEVTSGTGLSIEGELGVVTRTDTDQVVTLAATVSFREQEIVKEFTFTILALPSYQVVGTTEDEWSNAAGVFNGLTFTIVSTTDSTIYCEAVLNNSIDVTFRGNGTKNIKVDLKEKNSLISGTGSRIINGIINVYSSASKTHLLGQVTYKINYMYV